MKIIKLIALVLFFPCLIKAQSWKTVGTGVTRQGGAGIGVFFNDTLNNVLYVGGGFDSAGSVVSSNLAKWDGINWYGVGNNSAPVGIGLMTKINNDIYISNNLSNSVFKWNGVTWTGLPPFNGYVNAIASVNGELYAGGAFTMQGAIVVNHIAKWTGIAWVALGTGVGDFTYPSYIDAIAEYQGKLVAGGMFVRAGNDTANSIALWDGVNWSSLNQGVYDSGTVYGWDVYDLLVDTNDLYVAGRFVTASGMLVNGIAKWDGNNWSNLGDGAVYGMEVFDLGIYNDTLLAYGSFTPTFGLAKWNGINWESYSSEEISTMTFYLQDIIEFNNELYIGGTFNADSGRQVLNNIARRAVVDLASTDNNCFNNCEGMAMAPVIGIEPNTYLWNTGDTLETLNNLCTGVYSVTVTDSTGSSSFGNVTITSPPAIIITDTSTNAGCATCSNGTATVTVNGGTPPLTVMWSNGATTNTIDSLLHDTYTVTVTDNNGCILIDSVTVGFDVGVAQLIMDNEQLTVTPLNESSVTVHVHSSTISKAQLIIYNMQGQVISSKNITLRAGENNFTEPTPSAQGMYLLQLRTARQVMNVKFIKQ